MEILLHNIFWTMNLKSLTSFRAQNRKSSWECFDLSGCSIMHNQIIPFLDNTIEDDLACDVGFTS